MGDLGGGMLDPGLGSLGLASRDELKTQFMTREGEKSFSLIFVPTNKEYVLQIYV